jgi:dienelactone hydrolase
MTRSVYIPIVTAILMIAGCGENIKKNPGTPKASEKAGIEKRASYLEHLVKTYSSTKDQKPQEVPIWDYWLKTTGELPPDFDRLETSAIPPDLLKFRNGRTVDTPRDWEKRRQEILQDLEQYMFGKWPPPPSRTVIRYDKASPADNGKYIRQNAQVFYSPSGKMLDYLDKTTVYNSLDYSNFFAASLGVELYIPSGKGPFPSIIELGPAREQASPQDIERVKRGYIVCRFNRKDADFAAGVYREYECNQLEWWAYAASRCVDLICSREDTDKSKIAVAGHSRGGKTALIAALMDERISAVINSHPGTGAGSFNIWRYAGDKFGGETLENSTRRFPYWNNPRMRFFIGRENKLPVDNHSLLAMIAPRPCLMGTGERDAVGEVWGDHQCYNAVKEVYRLLGHEQNLGFYASPGAHEVTPVMIDAYLDWLDIQFGRKPGPFRDQFTYTYSFEKWKNIKGENSDINKFPEKDLNDILKAPDGKEIKTPADWEKKADHIRQQIKLITGELPAYDKIEQVTLENERKSGNDLLKAEIKFDEKLIAHLTWPAGAKEKIPAVIYLHAYLDANGYNWSRGYGYSTSVGERLAQAGFLAVEFDQFGYGQRNRDCGMEFCEQNPDISALGVMLTDVSRIIDGLCLLGQVDKERIMVSGYSLGGMVGLYAAAFDNRIKAVASACGFGSIRMDVHGNQTEGIKRYSHLRPTLPRLGLFLGNEKRIPFDFHELLALIAPRQVFILAPKFDQDWFYEDVEICYSQAAEIFRLFGKEGSIVLSSPDDFNRYPPEYQEQVNNWLSTASK